MSGVNGRVTIVTGAGRGIGLVTAKLLESRGAKVMAVARSETQLQSSGLDYVVADLGTPAGCKLAIEETRKRLGPIEILVCNHGIGSAQEKVIWQQDSKIWNDTMRINLAGPYLLSKLATKDMVDQGYGRVVYTSSTAGEIASQAGSAYATSKHGLLGLMRSVAQDTGAYNVTSNAVLPGWVRTSMAEALAEEEAKQLGVTVEEIWKERAKSYPAGRVVTPEEVAEVIAFLASEESSGVNGEAIKVALGSTW